MEGAFMTVEAFSKNSASYGGDGFDGRPMPAVDSDGEGYRGPDRRRKFSLYDQYTDMYGQHAEVRGTSPLDLGASRRRRTDAPRVGGIGIEGARNASKE
jgi:hypothetical protein